MVFSLPGGSVEIELRVCVDGGPDGASAGLAVATNDYLDAIVILRVGAPGRSGIMLSAWPQASPRERSKPDFTSPN